MTGTREEIEEWIEWSNEVATLIPESDVAMYSNPEGAQESIILDCFRAYVTERSEVLTEVRRERARQDQKWGEQNHPDGTGSDWAKHNAEEAKRATDHVAQRGMLTWRHILFEEVWEATAESDPAKLRTELIQVAAVATQWVEAIDRRAAQDDEWPAGVQFEDNYPGVIE